MWRAAARGVPATVLRPGRVAWHSRTGALGPDDLLSRAIRACVQLGAAPALDTAFDASLSANASLDASRASRPSNARWSIAERISVPSPRRRNDGWSEENAGGPIDDDGFDETFSAWWDAERATRTFFVVDVDGSAVGMANIKRYDRMPVAGRPSGGRWGYVGNVFVLPEHRNSKVGSALMNALIDWAWAAGMRAPREDRIGHLAQLLDLTSRPSSILARMNSHGARQWDHFPSSTFWG